MEAPIEDSLPHDALLHFELEGWKSVFLYGRKVATRAAFLCFGSAVPGLWLFIGFRRI